MREQEREDGVGVLVGVLHGVVVLGWLGWVGVRSWFGVDHPSWWRVWDRVFAAALGPVNWVLGWKVVEGSLVFGALALVLGISVWGRRSVWVAPLGLAIWPIWFWKWG